MKYVVQLTILLCLSLSCLIVKDINAQEPTPYQGQWCGSGTRCEGLDLDGDKIGDDVVRWECRLNSNLEPAETKTTEKTCNISEDLKCSSGDCVTAYKTKIYINPSTPSLPINQEDDLEFVVTGTGSCQDSLRINPGEGLRSLENQNCKLVASNCGSGNKWDNLKCWWQYQCVAYKPGLFNIAAQNDNSACASTVSYQIDPVNCRNERPPEIIDLPDSYPKDKIISHTLDDAVVEAMIKTVPDEVTFEALAKLEPTEPVTGVRIGFFNIISSAGCNTLIRWLTFGIFCPIGIQSPSVAQTAPQNQLAMLATKAELVSKAQVPEEAAGPPLPRDCYINDVLQEGVNQDGNKLLNKVSTSIGRPEGGYTNHMPDFKGMIFNNSRDNITYNERTFTNDDRVPGAVCQMYLYLLGTYPSEFFKDKLPYPKCIEADIPF